MYNKAYFFSGFKPQPEENQRWKLRYWMIFLGQAFSLIGSSLTQFVLMWWITDTTGSLQKLTMAGMAALIPQAILSPIGGVIADRYNRRFVMMTADIISALCMIILIYLFSTGQIQLWHIYVMLGIRGAMQAFQEPAAEASVAMLVPKSFIPRAAGLNQIVHGITLMASAPLGALAISIMPLNKTLMIDVVTAMIGIVPLIIFTIPQKLLPSEKNALANMVTDVKQGLSVIINHKGLNRLFLLLTAVVLIIMPTFTFVPLLIKEHFAGGVKEVGIMEGLAGAGMIAGGILVTLIAPKRQVVWILSGLGISCLSLGLTALVPSNAFYFGVFWWLISSLSFSFANAPMTALLQTIIPNELQGRVLSLLNMMMGVAAPVGLLLANPLGELLGIRWLFVVIGFVGCAVSLFGFFSPPLRKLGAADQKIESE